jgi:hypothetical protein
VRVRPLNNIYRTDLEIGTPCKIRIPFLDVRVRLRTISTHVLDYHPFAPAPPHRISTSFLDVRVRRLNNVDRTDLEISTPYKISTPLLDVRKLAPLKSLTPLLNRALICSLTHSLDELLTYSLTNIRAKCFTRSQTHFLTNLPEYSR